MSKTFCPYAWTHLSAATDGNIRLCCNVTDDDPRIRDQNNQTMHVADIKDIHISHSPKNIYKVQNTIKTSIHSVTNNSNSEYKPLLKEICFNHYNSNKANYKCINNIHNNIKSKLSEYSFIKLI